MSELKGVAGYKYILNIMKLGSLDNWYALSFKNAL